MSYMQRIFTSITYLLTVTLLTTAFSAKAQLVVDDSPTDSELAAALVGEGVTISGVELDCASGAYGFFECVDCNVGIPSGVVLTSGSIFETVGPNNSSGAGACPGTPGDSDLEDYIDDITNDACVLEFDVTVTSDSLSFNYVFGSDEYLEYVFSFNDGFAFFIDGPGIVGTQNIALVPGTTDPVSIDNVNNVVNPEYYVDNGTGFEAPYSTDDYYIQYDGFTTVLTAKAAVIPCETYHLKLVVADALDCILDSGVFIEAGSLNSPGVAITYDADIDGYLDLIEGCNNGLLTFDLSFPPVDSFYVVVDVSGTATPGEDYSAIPDSILFLPGDTLVTIPITVFEDALEEGIETIVIYVELGCAFGFGDSLVINILDFLPIEASPLDTIICPGGTATLTASGADTYTWSPSDGLSSTTGSSVNASPDVPTTYTVTGTLFACESSLDLNVDLEEPVADAGADTTIFFGESAILNGSGGVGYTWSPAATLANSNTANPIATPLETTTLTLTIETELGCIAMDEVTVFVSGDAVVWVPNAFSPNQDGYNDLFTIIVRGEISFYELNIFNRWGELVYTGNVGAPGWDGFYNNKEQPMGTYVYTLRWSDNNGNDFSEQGHFMLVR
jgi:gliding motility-associated-like protein